MLSDCTYMVVSQVPIWEVLEDFGAGWGPGKHIIVTEILNKIFLDHSRKITNSDVN